MKKVDEIIALIKYKKVLDFLKKRGIEIKGKKIVDLGSGSGKVNYLSLK